ncbi:hypothetical protein D3C86_962200 [compost metagenome]
MGIRHQPGIDKVHIAIQGPGTQLFGEAGTVQRQAGGQGPEAQIRPQPGEVRQLGMVKGGDDPVGRGEAELALCPPGQGCHRLCGVRSLELYMQLAAPGNQAHHLPQGRDPLPVTRIQARQIVPGLLGQHPVAVGATLQPPVVEDPELAVCLLHVELDGADSECDGYLHRLEGVLRRQFAGTAMGNDLHDWLLLLVLVDGAALVAPYQPRRVR